MPQDLLAFPPKALSSLDAVVSTPVFARDGSLVSTPGHHASESLWLHLDPSLGELHVPESPTAADLAGARGLLLEHLLFDFPFVDPSDRTHMIAALLLPFARRLVTGCTPLHVIEAPTPGSGKGLLTNLLGIIATGAVCNGCTLPGEEEEVRKKLSAELAMGRPIILLDNLPEKRVTDSATLASVLTAETWTDRLLGATRMLTLPNRAVWLCSANNPRFSLELVRRSVRIRIDPKQDMPWHRSGFRHDPILDWARDNRPKLVRALLTLIRAWVAADRPAGKRSLGSFESWARVIGGILKVAGIEGFLANSTAFYAEADEEGEAWRAFTKAWWEKFGPTPVRVLELNELCDAHDLLVRERGDGPARSQQTKLGNLLRAKRDRVFGELRIGLAHDGGHKGKLYALSNMKAELAALSRSDGAARTAWWIHGPTHPPSRRGTSRREREPSGNPRRARFPSRKPWCLHELRAHGEPREPARLLYAQGRRDFFSARARRRKICLRIGPERGVQVPEVPQPPESSLMSMGSGREPRPGTPRGTSWTFPRWSQAFASRRRRSSTPCSRTSSCTRSVAASYRPFARRSCPTTAACSRAICARCSTGGRSAAALSTPAASLCSCSRATGAGRSSYG